jgi:hypothetical protein
VDDGLAYGGSSTTVYEGLRAALAEKVRQKSITLTVPNRPEVKLVFAPNFEFETYDGWVKKATDKKGNIDQMRVALTVLAHCNTQILFGGEVVRKGGDGEELTITHSDIHSMLGAPIGGTGAAIRKLYGSDGHAIQTMKKVVEAAGYTVEGDVLELDEDDSPLVD